jgi:hypothetical protein
VKGGGAAPGRREQGVEPGKRAQSRERHWLRRLGLPRRGFVRVVLALVLIELVLNVAFCQLTLAAGKCRVAIFTDAEKRVFARDPKPSFRHGQTPILGFSPEPAPRPGQPRTHASCNSGRQKRQKPSVLPHLVLPTDVPLPQVGVGCPNKSGRSLEVPQCYDTSPPRSCVSVTADTFAPLVAR